MTIQLSEKDFREGMRLLQLTTDHHDKIYAIRKRRELEDIFNRTLGPGFKDSRSYNEYYLEDGKWKKTELAEWNEALAEYKKSQDPTHAVEVGKEAGDMMFQYHIIMLRHRKDSQFFTYSLKVESILDKIVIPQTEEIGIPRLHALFLEERKYFNRANLKPGKKLSKEEEAEWIYQEYLEWREERSY